jgi:hypothetical protein
MDLIELRDIRKTYHLGEVDLPPVALARAP